MEVITRARRRRKDVAQQMPSVCASMALTATAFRNVDLPEALEPVTSVFFAHAQPLGTGWLTSGWVRPSKREPGASSKAARQVFSPSSRNAAAEKSASSSPMAA